MRRTLRIAVWLVAPARGLCAQASAQTQTTVTATVTDPNGIPYAGARLSILLVSPGGAVPHLTPCGSGLGCQIQNPPPVTLDATGSINPPLLLWANASILPAGSTYTFSITEPGVAPPLGTGPQSFTLAGVTIAGASPSLSASLSARAPKLTFGGGGGTGCLVSGTVNEIVTNSGTGGCTSSPATADSTGNVIVPANLRVTGPDPWVDVTAPPFNADPTGATDATAAIQAAITQACATGGSVFFPAASNGFYLLSQPQTPSTSPVLVIPCSGMHLIGGNSHNPGGSPSHTAPRTELLVNNVGGSPNALPVFGLGYGYNGGLYQDNGTTFENLNIVGHNQAVGLYATGQITFKNTSLAAGSAATGQTDNTAFKFTNSIEIYFLGGGLQTPSTVPCSIWSGETSVAAEAQVAGLIHMENAIVSCGLGMEYIQRVVSGGPVPGSWHLNDVIMENATNAIFTVTNTSGSLMTVSGIDFENVTSADSPSTQALLFFNGQSADRLSGVVMNHAVAGSGGVATIMAAGTNLSNFQTNACVAACTAQVVDASGNPFGNGQVQDLGGGVDFFDPTNTQNSTPYLSNLNNVSARFYKNGNANANLGGDA